MSDHDHDSHDHGRHHHAHDHSHLTDVDWAAMASHATLEGEVMLGYVTDTARRVLELRGADAPAVRRVLDVGSGPGVGTCELARCFPDATVMAFDSSPAMLEHAAARAARLDLTDQVVTHLGELPDGVAEVEPADVIWASLSLHHVGDEVAALRALRDRLAPGGLLAIAEFGDPTRTLPADLDVGEPGLVERLAALWETWFAHMRAGLPGATESQALTAMVEAAGLEVVEASLARIEFEAPLTGGPREVVTATIARAGRQFGDHLSPSDLEALAVLADPDDPRGVANRDDVFLHTSRQIVIARAAAD